MLLAILTLSSDERLSFRANRLMTCESSEVPDSGQDCLGLLSLSLSGTRPRSVVAGVLWLMERGGGEQFGAARLGAPCFASAGNRE